MLKTFFFFALASVFFTINSVAQSSVTITPKKIVYTRKNVPKYKRTVEVRYPIVGGALKPTVKTKLENTINYWRNFETTLKEELSNTWLETLDYEVNHNGNGILGISLRMDGSGAYPDYSAKNIVINLKTGEKVKFADVFKSEMLGKLAAMIDKKLAAEKKEIFERIEEEKDATKEDKDSLKEQVSALKFTAENFDEFSVNAKGVTFHYDAGFPHVIQALEPEGRYFFSYNELKPFIKTNSILGQFIK
jgi:hypothetical protein